MSSPPLAAVVQLTSTSDREANWQQAQELVSRAAERGARLVATPENTNFLGPHTEKVKSAETLAGETCSRFADLAARLGVQILFGSFKERSDDPDRCFNTSVLFGVDGSQLAVYRNRIGVCIWRVPGQQVVAARSRFVTPFERAGRALTAGTRGDSSPGRV